uniref:Calcineurin-like phosphoesterase domain-containing protein n=1 Tax=Romanomermis culicivorax TaxID=13658 RepID=A0A915L500_ROMCU
MAGNHDHYGNIMGQIGYTAINDRWIFPWLYYKLSYDLNDGTNIDLIVIDTVVLCEFGHKFGRRKPHTYKIVEVHWKWIENQLNKSKAHYIFVSGHNPVYSIGSHGPTKCLIDKLKPMLEKYHVAAYFSGHDHNLQVVSGAGGFASRRLRHIDDVPDGSSIFHYPDSPVEIIHNKTNPNSTKGGFVLVRVDKSKAEFIFYNGRKDIVYSFSVGPRAVSH